LDNDKEGGKDIFLVDGGQMKLSNLSICIDKRTNEISLEPPDIKLRFDVCPEWLDIALNHLDECTKSANSIQDALKNEDNELIGKSLKNEFSSGMQAIVSSCTALDAFYELIKEHAEIPEGTLNSWRANRTAKYARITETIRVAYNIKHESSKEIRKFLKEAFSFRDKAIHPNQKFMHPALHPELNRVVDVKFVLFRHYNAKVIVYGVLSCIQRLCGLKNIKNAEIIEFSEQLAEKIKPTINKWNANYGDPEI